MREQPYVALVATACIGFVFAGLFRRRGSPSAQLSADLAGTVNEIGRSLRHSVRQITQPRHGVARALGAAITTVATQAAVNEVRRRVAPAPDSRQEFQSPKGDTDESGA